MTRFILKTIKLLFWIIITIRLFISLMQILYIFKKYDLNKILHHEYNNRNKCLFLNFVLLSIFIPLEIFAFSHLFIINC